VRKCRRERSAKECVGPESTAQIPGGYIVKLFLVMERASLAAARTSLRAVVVSCE